jgi:ribA/ribD-fused uncharacterized protein
MKVIRFYEPEDPYGFLSNFYPSPIFMKGKTWPTSEHYYQAQKVAGTGTEEVIRSLETPREAFDITRTEGFPQRPDWHEIRDEVMREVVYNKFIQHPDLKMHLLETEDAVLVEHSFKDSYWGDGGDGKGKNVLGKILMEVRERLKGENDGGSGEEEKQSTEAEIE